MIRTMMVSMLALAVSAAADPSPATITQDRATQAARALHANARIIGSELETEDGKHIWSFDLKDGDKTREVWVDAETGAVVKDAVESARQESDEKILDRAEAVLKKSVACEMGEGELRHGRDGELALFRLKMADGATFDAFVDPVGGKIVRLKAVDGSRR